MPVVRRTGEGVIVWDSDDAGDDAEQEWCAILTPATEPWEIRCDAAVLTGRYIDGGLRVGARVGVEYERADVEGFRYVARSAWLLPYDPAVLEPIIRDVATTGPGAREYVVRVADNAWNYYAHDPDYFIEYVVEQVQQDMHDSFADISWPACPRHPHHPMWYSDGHWRCATDKVPIVALGELSRLRGS